MFLNYRRKQLAERRKMIKVLAFNCSPKMDKGNTALILTPFLEGMREAGAKVELFYTRKLKLTPAQASLTAGSRIRVSAIRTTT